MLTLLLSFFTHASDDDYVGANTCGSCHQQQYQQWRQSHHYNSMQMATSDYVLGDFNNVVVTFHNIKNRLYKKDERFFIDTMNQEGEPQEFEIKYTFGFYPLQQYLVELEGGHIQALNVAWDSRPKQEGGQRWFHLRPDNNITPEHPFFWSRYFQNWNSRCADCHSTNLKRNYDLENHRFDTRWSEINVACEACHGPGEKHLDVVSTGKYSANNTGFAFRKHKALFWQFAENAATAHTKNKKNDRHIDMCGSCHALRVQLDTHPAEASFHNTNQLQLPTQPHYYVDGQILEEAFVLGSFLQSAMYEKGVTCTNCHHPHTNKLIAEGNRVCSQCHDAQVFDIADHHHHPVESEGAQCVNCHMPARTYMQMDARRDHRFVVPRPQLSEDLSVPNACTQCHEGKDNQWASKALAKWGVKADKDHWAYLSQRAHARDITVTDVLAKTINSGALSNLTEATLLALFADIPSPVSVALAQKKLRDESPLIRRAAVSSLANLPPDLRWQILSPYLDDPQLSVRYQLAEALADVLSRLPENQRQRLDRLIREYRQSLSLSAASPATQLSIALLETRLGNMQAAEKAYMHALHIEPNYVPALINLADFYRGVGKEEKIAPLLQNALKTAPDSGAAQHSYGLYLVRKKDYTNALPFLKAAIETADAQARYAYVYAVALDNQGQTKEAIRTLVSANSRWPKQYDILLTLVLYLEKAGETFSIPSYVAELKTLAPNSPTVINLSQRYGE